MLDFLFAALTFLVWVVVAAFSGALILVGVFLLWFKKQVSGGDFEVPVEDHPDDKPNIIRKEYTGPPIWMNTEGSGAKL